MSTNVHIAAARLLMHGLVTSGVRHLIVSPGSRSTPLVLAAAEEPELRCETIIDERSAAFFALGQVRATGEPTALLCTSGTAAAHYFPAIIEASETFLPLMVITADRPWDAYDVASPQTIDQLKLFGTHVRGFFEVGLPDATPSALRGVPRIAAQAAHLARYPTPGPVHVNVHYRKPLEPVAVGGREPWEDEFDRLLARGAPKVHAASRGSDRSAVEQLARASLRAQRGLIACGPSPFPFDAHLSTTVDAFALATGFPILAEATSQLRFGSHAEGTIVCGGFDTILRQPDAFEAPDLIVEIGSTPISGAWASFVERHASALRWIVAPHGWHDPFNSAEHVVLGDPATLLQEAAAWITAADDRRPSDWGQRWGHAEQRVWQSAEARLGGPHLTEASAARVTVGALPAGAWLIAGNSGPVRDLDTWVPPNDQRLRVVHQRGASGIDGLVSGAAGLRSVVREPVLLYFGDVSMLHDLGGLAAARHAKQPLLIVVVQNDGGRIFEQLPIAGRADDAVFSRHFTTPHGLSFEQAAGMFGIAWRRVDTTAALHDALAHGLKHPGPTLIEAIVPPSDGQPRRQALWGGQ